LVVASACSTPLHHPNGQKDAASTGDGSDVDSTTQMSGLVRYIGQLPMTSTTPFGGAPFCKYTVTMKPVVIDVSIDEMMNLKWMVVDNTMIEALVGTCGAPALPATLEGYEYPGDPQPPQTGGTYAPTLNALAANSPTATIAVTLTPESTTSFASTIRWHRTDAAALLDWTVNTPGPVDVTQVSCDVGAEYCLGGTQQGSMYGCVDGTHLTMLKPCTMGCARAPLPPLPHGNEHCN
jgi:hypothetical protein